MNLADLNKIHFIGIGGIGMSGLAKYFLYKGLEVSGYDKVETELTRDLVRDGADIHYKDNLDLIPDINEIDLVVYTPAIPEESCQLTFFKNGNYVVRKRAEVLGDITKSYNTIAVAGTHGKTTTSSIVAHILQSSNNGGVAFLGGIATNYDSNILLEENDIAVVEADEYDRSFLQLQPDTVVLTSMDADHLDIYGASESVKKSFFDFVALLKDPNLLIVEENIAENFKTKLSYGFSNSSDLHVKNLKIKQHAYLFDFVYKGEIFRDFTFKFPGRHNLLNAAGATLACLINGVAFEDIKEGLSTFLGVKRRFEVHVDTAKTTFIDDYAHHPKEINALINAIKEFYPARKIVGIFQPHLFSRTRDFMDEFANVLSKMDKVILLPIYPARELPIEGVNSEFLLDKIKHDNKVLINEQEKIFECVSDDSPKVVVTIGAGDIDLLVPKVKKYLLENA